MRRNTRRNVVKHKKKKRIVQGCWKRKGKGGWSNTRERKTCGIVFACGERRTIFEQFGTDDDLEDFSDDEEYEEENGDAGIRDDDQDIDRGLFAPGRKRQKTDAQRMGLKCPPLHVSSPHEKRIFNEFMAENPKPSSSNWRELAKLFKAKTNFKTILAHDKEEAKKKVRAERQASRRRAEKRQKMDEPLLR